MEITWHGDTCFKIKGEKTTVVIDPNKEASKLKGEVVLTSMENSVEVEGEAKRVDWPGEYEIKGVLIAGTKIDNTIVYCFKMDNIRFCHLGEIENVPSGEIIKEIGDIDILMIGIGGDAKLDSKKAIEVVENIGPKIIIPMSSPSSIASFKNMGVGDVEPLDKLEIKSASDLPTDQTRYVSLNTSL